MSANSSIAALSPVEIIECPRDAMQGWPHPISTDRKVEYLNMLLQVGFQTLDFGSFVSPKAIPQMADTALIMDRLNATHGATRLLAIVANLRGAQEASAFSQIQDLGFPFSVSETFQQRNTGSSIAESLRRVESIQNLCIQKGKRLVVYLSMAFGNPYGDPFSEDWVFAYAKKLAGLGIQIISLADTVGLATAGQVGTMSSYLIRELPRVQIGVHLHAPKGNWHAKLEAALQAGCRRIDSALLGIGGCPMAGDVLVGNLSTDELIPFLEEKGLLPPLNMPALRAAVTLARDLFQN